MVAYDYDREARLLHIQQINLMLERATPLGLSNGEGIALWGDLRSLLNEEDATH